MTQHHDVTIIQLISVI